MAYSKTTWTDGTTPIDASNLNKIEDALSDQDSRIDKLSSSLQYFGAIDVDELDNLNSAANNGIYLIWGQDLFGTGSKVYAYVLNMCDRASFCFQVAFFNSTPYVAIRYLVSGNWYAWRGVSASNWAIIS